MNLRQRNEEGFTLIEVMISIFLIAIIMSALASLIAGSARQATTSGKMIESAAIAHNQLDTITAVDYKSWKINTSGGNISFAKPTVEVTGTDGNKYVVVRHLEQLKPDPRDRSKANEPKLLSIKVEVTPKDYKNAQTYTVSTLLSTLD